MPILPPADFDDRLAAYLRSSGLAEVASPEEQYTLEPSGIVVTVMSNGDEVFYDPRTEQFTSGDAS
jgi:hypothetical protein